MLCVQMCVYSCALIGLQVLTVTVCIMLICWYKSTFKNYYFFFDFVKYQYKFFFQTLLKEEHLNQVAPLTISSKVYIPESTTKEAACLRMMFILGYAPNRHGD